MANYIKQSLEEGETIIFKGRLHWSYIFRYLLFSLLFLVGGIFVIYLAYYKYPEASLCWCWLSLPGSWAASCVLAASLLSRTPVSCRKTASSTSR